MTADPQRHEVVVVGAGVSGIYQIKRLTDLGIDAIVLEADDDLGGTWYRNRYPGARFDSESYTYGYSFSKELLDEWHWKERFSAQPENLRYLNYVADKFDLRRHMRFDARVETMTWDEDERVWHLGLQSGEALVARFVITSLGPLSIPTLPSYEGIDDFEGEAFHTYWWPKEPVALEGRRVGVIGTGATGIQVISEIADQVGELTVFQRRPNWSTPLNNAPISDEEMDRDPRPLRRDLRQLCPLTRRVRARAPARLLEPDGRGTASVLGRALRPAGLRAPGRQLRRDLLRRGGQPRDLRLHRRPDPRSGSTTPIWPRSSSPGTTGSGCSACPLETHYFEAYNRDNVRLVDLSETPIERFTPTGIQTTGRITIST